MAIGYCNTLESFYEACGHYNLSSSHRPGCHPSQNGQCVDIAQKSLHYSVNQCFWCRNNGVYTPSEVGLGMIVLLDRNNNQKIDKKVIASRARLFMKRIELEAKRIAEARSKWFDGEDKMRRLREAEEEKLTKVTEAEYIPICEHPLDIEPQKISSLLMRAVFEDDDRVCWVVQPGKVETQDRKGGQVPYCTICRENFVCGQDVRRLPCCMTRPKEDWNCVFHKDCILGQFEGRKDGALKWYGCPKCDFHFKLLRK